jgi:phenylacetate-coenzyme A ligase PaaK-like adenylate-forming protein
MLEAYVAVLATLDKQSEDFILEFQRRRLKRIFNYAQKTIWWHRYFDTQGVVFQEGEEVTDLQKIPPVLRAALLDVPKEELLVVRKTHKALLWRKTSGSTTGTPFIWGMHRADMIVHDAGRYMSAFLERGFDFTKYAKQNFYSEFNRNADPVTGPFPLFQGGYFFARRNNVDYAERVQRLHQYLVENNINILRTSPYELEILVEEFQRQGLPPPPVALCCFVGLELPERERRLAETYFGARVLMNYGMQEIGAIGIECQSNPGQYHTSPERVLVEILDEKNQPVLNGEVGKIVITCLDNITMPLLRYHTGDIGVLHKESSCSCQNQTPRLEVKNRHTEVLQLQNGRTYEVRKILRRFGQEPFVSQVRRVQVRQDSLNSITIFLEVRDIEQRKKNLLPDHLNVQVTFKQVSLIPEDTAKFRFFVPLERQS